MSDEQNTLREELKRIEEAITAQENLRGVLPDEQIEVTLAQLREKRSQLLAQAEPAAVERRDIHAPGSTIDGSAVSGQVKAGGAFVGRDLVIIARQVSGDFWQQLNVSEPDLERATTRYLTHLVNRYQFLDLKGMGVSDRVPLRLPLVQMYVPLKARIEMPEGETWARELHLAGRGMSVEEAEAAGRRLSEPQPVLDLLQKQDGLIILGDPGAGKTTVLKYLAVRLALGQGEALGLGNRLPVLLPLSAYANALAEGDNIPLHRFMAQYYEELGVDEPLGPMLDEALDKGGALLLLDGLDEVRDLGRRHTVVRRVMDFFAYRQQDGNKFILTSRIVGYRDVRPAGTGMAECTLVDFDDDEIELFVGQWTGALERAARGDTDVAALEAAREQAELIDSVRHNPGVRRLAANPLLLTILALMKRQGVVLPERRVELYDTYVEILLKHWNLARGLGRPPARDLDVVETVRVLAPLALWMHETSPGVGLVKREAMRRKLVQILSARQMDDPEGAARRLLLDVHDYTGLLLERGAGMYGFIHLTFQEYLAAVAVAQQGQGDVAAVVDALAPHVGDDNWREVTLLTIGYMGIRQQLDELAGQVLLRLIEAEPGAPGEAVVLAGEAVADTWPGGVTRSSRAKVIEALLATMENTERVAPQRRAEAGRALARVGDPRPEVMTVDGMEFCFVPAGVFWMGSEEGRDVEKPLHQVDIPYDYWLGRFPVTNAQFTAFVEAGGYGEEEFWPEARAADYWRDGRFKGRWDSEWRDRPAAVGQTFALANHPVVGVTWYEALAFCRWLTQRWQEEGRLPAGWAVQLPSEAEWEKGARGGLQIPSDPFIAWPGMQDAILHPTNKPTSQQTNHPSTQQTNPSPHRTFPWGDDAPTANDANYKETGIEATSSAGCFPSNASPYGCAEMSGNVWEWTRSHWKPLPYDAGDGRETLDAGPDTWRVIRGGSWGSSEGSLRCAYRLRYLPYFRYVDCGFRVCVSPFSIPTAGL